jgi:hypothetical protein
MATDDADERGSSLESFDFSIKSALIGVHPWQKREKAEWPQIARTDTDRAKRVFDLSDQIRVDRCSSVANRCLTRGSETREPWPALIFPPC